MDWQPRLSHASPSGEMVTRRDLTRDEVMRGAGDDVHILSRDHRSEFALGDKARHVKGRGAREQLCPTVYVALLDAWTLRFVPEGSMLHNVLNACQEPADTPQPAGHHGKGTRDTKVVQDVWLSAAGLFESQTHDARKILYLKHSIQSEPQLFHKNLLDLTKKLVALRFTKERNSWQGRLQRVLQTVDDHSQIGDAFVQGQSPPVTFAWGSTRLIVRLATAQYTVASDIASNLFDISQQLSSAEERIRAYPYTDALLDAARHLFASALLYLVNAILFLQNELWPARAVKAVAGGSVKFKKMYQDIQRHTNSVDREFSNAVEIYSRYRTQLEWFRQHLAPSQKSFLKPSLPVSGTGQWLLRSDEFRAWDLLGYSNVLLVQGAPGCGKSVLADCLSLNTELRFQHSCHGSSRGLSDFCSAILAWLMSFVVHSSLMNTWHAMVAGVTVPLALQAQASRIDLKSMQMAILQVFFKAEFPETTIIIDALAERHNEVQPLFNFLESISQSPRVRVIAFSRVSLVPTAVRIIQMNETRVMPDVESYVRERIQRSKNLQHLENRILHAISRTCSGLFMLMSLLLDDLEAAATLEEQDEVLHTAPGCLFDRFEQRWIQATRKLTPRQMTRRLDVFALLVVACRPLTITEISSFIALHIDTNTIRPECELSDPSRTIEEDCGPFVSVNEGKVEISHPVMRDYVVSRPLARRDSSSFMAERCLSVLNEPRYASVPFAAALLRKHLLPTGLLVSGTPLIINDESLPYEYAALNWQSHVTAVSKPSTVLLKKLEEFITSIAAVTWSERLIDIRDRNESSSINAQIDVRAELSAWLVTLPPALQKQVSLNQFFIGAHLKIQKELERDDQEDRLLPYLPAVRLGQYFSIAGTSDDDFRMAYQYKESVVAGYTKVLGKRSPLTLQARTDFINEFFSQGLIAEAEVELIEVVNIEREVLGTESDAYYSALQLLGNAQYYLSKFSDASRSLLTSGEGLLRLRGRESWDYQVNNLYLGWVYERVGDLGIALELYQRIVDTWVPIRAKTNGLSIFAFTSRGSIYRKMAEYERARTELEFSWESRLRLFSINSNTTVDSGLQLALLYRDMGLTNEAQELLIQVEKSSVFEKDFERGCQVQHIRALVAFDQGQFSDPVRELTRIVDDTIGSKRDQNNRECLWIRIALADALRHVGRDAAALMVFSELVEPLEDDLGHRPLTPTLDDEPEPPTQLRAAEEALRMVKDRDFAGAVQSLRSKGLQWKREADFFIRQGGPPADTAWVRPIDFKVVSVDLDRPQDVCCLGELWLCVEYQHNKTIWYDKRLLELDCTMSAGPDRICN